MNVREAGRGKAPLIAKRISLAAILLFVAALAGYSTAHNGRKTVLIGKIELAYMTNLLAGITVFQGWSYFEVLVVSFHRTPQSSKKRSD